MAMRCSIIIGAVLMAAAPAGAAVTVFGGGDARLCFEAAKAGRSDDESIGKCTQALSRSDLAQTDRGGTYVNRGVMYLRRMDLGPAQADLDQGVQLNPTAGEGWLDRGAVYIAEKHMRVAINYINRAIELGVSEPEKAYYNRARAEEEIDDLKAAYYDYLKAVEIKPDWALPQSELKRFKVTQK
jgi:tetratricopeptide (TPR) repeat protein